jgi:hypothetical protein
MIPSGSEFLGHAILQDMAYIVSHLIAHLPPQKDTIVRKCGGKQGSTYDTDKDVKISPWDWRKELGQIDKDQRNRTNLGASQIKDSIIMKVLEASRNTHTEQLK